MNELFYVCFMDYDEKEYALDPETGNSFIGTADEADTFIQKMEARYPVAEYFIEEAE